jgi:hypothetical protein
MNTQIHKEYEEESEAMLVKIVGAPLITRVCEGMEGFLERSGSMERSDRITNALYVLESMTDYRTFKQTMLIQKQDRVPTPSINVKGKNLTTIDMDGAMDGIHDLRVEGEWSRAGQIMIKGHSITLDTKPIPGGKKKACRLSYQLAMPYEQVTCAVER